MKKGLVSIVSIILLLSLFAIGYAEDTTEIGIGTCDISGVVLYYFNDNYGYMADAGAYVYLKPIKAENVGKETERIKEYSGTLLASQRGTGSKEAGEKLYAMEEEIKKLKIIAIADGDGRFYIKRIPAGDYIIYILSDHRMLFGDKHYSNIEAKVIHLEEGQYLEVWSKFSY